MKLPNEVNPDIWIRYAESDLALAQTMIDNPAFPRQTAYHAQQAAEKAIKAVLLHLRIVFPFTHDLPRLLQLVPVALQPTLDMQRCAELSEWSVADRYPTDVVIAHDDAAAGITLAECITLWAQKILATKETDNA